MVRGLVFAGVMVVLRLIQGAVINAWPTTSGLISVVLLLLFTIGVVAWGVIDGRADANASPDPDRRQDLAMTWLLGGIAAGLLSGLVSSLISMFYKGLYTGGLLSEITTFAAFVALLVFVPAIIGVAIGRWRIDRQYAKQPVRHHGLAAKEGRDDADVFSAVRADESPTGEIPVQRSAVQTEERTAAVATAEREAPTEAIDTHGRHTQAAPTREYEGHTEAAPTREHEARTEAINTGGSESPTEVVRLDPDATRRGNKPNRD
jgi:predicted lipid-binding transport protein (Tim44 family)